MLQFEKHLVGILSRKSLFNLPALRHPGLWVSTLISITDRYLISTYIPQSKKIRDMVLSSDQKYNAAGAIEQSRQHSLHHHITPS